MDGQQAPAVFVYPDADDGQQPKQLQQQQQQQQQQARQQQQQQQQARQLQQQQQQQPSVVGEEGSIQDILSLYATTPPRCFLSPSPSPPVANGVLAPRGGVFTSGRGGSSRSSIGQQPQHGTDAPPGAPGKSLRKRRLPSSSSERMDLLYLPPRRRRRLSSNADARGGALLPPSSGASPTPLFSPLPPLDATMGDGTKTPSAEDFFDVSGEFEKMASTSSPEPVGALPSTPPTTNGSSDDGSSGLAALREEAASLNSFLRGGEQTATPPTTSLHTPTTKQLPQTRNSPSATSPWQGVPMPRVPPPPPPTTTIPQHPHIAPLHSLLRDYEPLTAESALLAAAGLELLVSPSQSLANSNTDVMWTLLEAAIRQGAVDTSVDAVQAAVLGALQLKAAELSSESGQGALFPLFAPGKGNRLLPPDRSVGRLSRAAAVGLLFPPTFLDNGVVVKQLAGLKVVSREAMAWLQHVGWLISSFVELKNDPQALHDPSFRLKEMSRVYEDRMEKYGFDTNLRGNATNDGSREVSSSFGFFKALMADLFRSPDLATAVLEVRKSVDDNRKNFIEPGDARAYVHFAGFLLGLRFGANRILVAALFSRDERRGRVLLALAYCIRLFRCPAGTTQVAE